MSTTRNIDSINPKQGEFHPSVPRSEPLTTKGHKPGVKVGNDAYPEFHAETYPAGTAPKENSFQPDLKQATPGQALNPNAETYTSPNDFPGATSADVNTGLGKPMQGQTSNEVHGAHPRHRKKESAGLEGVGASAHDSFKERHLDLGYDPASRRNVSDIPGAEERYPATAEEVASERH
ncbi:hypothetical protein CGRA01v4_14909 [Colletotrichum graminicola]|uniref:Uncharacterized protein n=1 Tax=Colletotrichum graminicola (strain M1.001 / M2 / FGSC 10212) TaxID=645133 RepID=E3QFI6_COLGM|nr:uncharacterized protein GLRG_04768 [Colletotrichum graminicola M1.001]EFQ29624.1 hypothetical protein GLRG_04768 [Colletotrichum graminicola M1.001]WDK23617.1 hypothetical protein CGRA01v4_14909 [Colletotrichum graminicola]